MPPHVGPHFVLPLLNVNPPLPHWSPCPINHSHLSVSIQLQLNKHETSSSFPSKMLSYIIPFPSIILRNPFWFFPINFCGPGGFLWFQYAAGSDAARPFKVMWTAPVYFVEFSLSPFAFVFLSVTTIHILGFFVFYINK